MKKYIIVCFILSAVIISNARAQNSVVNFSGNKRSVTLETGSSIQSIYPVTDLSYPKVSEQSNTGNKISAGLNWDLFFTAPGRVFKDVSFANAQTGFIVTELGSLYKTTNGGVNWISKLNLGFPYYWYGVFALSPDTVVISGFNNQGDIHSGVIRWSFNGGTTWTSDITLYIPAGVGWLDRIHFFNSNDGIIFAGLSGAIHYTTNGGKDSASWNQVQVNSDLAWFAGNYDFQNSGNIYATGIHFAKSTDMGISWSTSSSADFVFDGGVDFLDENNNYGWTGGGQISSPVSGWVHRTTDHGVTWSNRLNEFPYPIRSVKFFDQNSGIVCGGNVFGEEGGIYSTTNGGNNWNLDINTSAEMFTISIVKVDQDSSDIWCVGSTGGSTGYTGKAYKKRIGNIPVGISHHSSNDPEEFILHQNFPNPFNPSTKISYTLTKTQYIILRLYDVLGNEVATLVHKEQPAGRYSIEWPVRGNKNYASGIYFYRLETNDFNQTKMMLMLK